mmetsp:Transcript_65913/g.117212  ORF Transcript_65913/g.117212 Transcript_65913/m.117212 type:complete len:97 (-) Transcript_65913:1295-1585(-)
MRLLQALIFRVPYDNHFVIDWRRFEVTHSCCREQSPSCRVTEQPAKFGGPTPNGAPTVAVVDDLQKSPHLGCAVSVSTSAQRNQRDHALPLWTADP